MTVSDVTAPTASAARAGKTNNPLIDSDFQTFLLMLTTQMQNQDPLNPIQSSDFAVQLATFSGVEQQVRTNRLLESLAAQIGATGMAQFANWVGMEARAAVPVWFDGAPVTLSPNPAATADRAELVVHDAAGREVGREAAALSAGHIDWAGTGADGAPLPAGLYSFRLESYAGGALLSSDPVEVYATVAEAQGADGGVVLVLEGGARLPASEVTALRLPPGR